MTPQPQTTLGTLRITLRQNWHWLAVLIFLLAFPFIVGAITGDSPYGIERRPGRVEQIGESINWQGVMIDAYILAILAMSYNLMFGFAGVISFGHALFFGLGGYTLGILLEESSIAGGTAGFWLAVVIGLLLAGVVGFIIGLVSLRLKGVYFAIFTLAVAEMGYIYVSRWGFTNAEDGFAVRNLPFNPSQDRLGYYYIVLVITVLVFLLLRRLINSPTGRVMLAVRENEDRAQAIGYNALMYKLTAITVASMLAAAAGMLYIIFNKKVGPEIMSVNYTMDPLIMTIIGGIGTFAGPVVGAAGLHLLERVFKTEFVILGSAVNIGEHWSLIMGIIFVVVVLAFPQGIVGTLNKWWFKRKTEKSPPPSLNEPGVQTLQEG